MEIGTFASEVTGDNAKAGEAVKLFAWATGAPRNATYQQLMDHTTRELVAYMVKIGRQRYVADAAEVADGNAGGIIGFGGQTT
jgi:hypothetical protein